MGHIRYNATVRVNAYSCNSRCVSACELKFKHQHSSFEVIEDKVNGCDFAWNFLTPRTIACSTACSMGEGGKPVEMREKEKKRCNCTEREV
jgi:hypothetical protein